MHVRLDNYVLCELDGTLRLLFEGTGMTVYVWLDRSHVLKAFQLIDRGGRVLSYRRGGVLTWGMIETDAGHRSVRAFEPCAGEAVLPGMPQAPACTRFQSLLDGLWRIAHKKAAEYRLTDEEIVQLSAMPHSVDHTQCHESPPASGQCRGAAQ